MSNFSKAIEYQWRAIYAILMREIQTRFGEKKIGFFWAVFESLAHVVVFASLKHILKVPGPDGINIILFLITGIVPFFYFRNIVSRMGSAFESNKNLLTISQVSFLDFYYVRTLLETVLVLISLPIILILGIIFVSNSDYYYFTGYEINDILQVLLGLLMLGLLGFGYGLIISSLSVINKAINMVSAVFVRVLYFTSGVLISVDKIPYRYHYILEWNPFVHCMEILRVGFFSEYTPYDYLMDYKYVFTVALTLIFFGLILAYRTKSWVLK